MLPVKFKLKYTNKNNFRRIFSIFNDYTNIQTHFEYIPFNFQPSWIFPEIHISIASNKHVLDRQYSLPNPWPAVRLTMQNDIFRPAYHHHNSQ